MSGTALKRVLSRAQMRLADRSGACEGPGGSRTEHMQQESGYVGGVPKMAAGADRLACVAAEQLRRARLSEPHTAFVSRSKPLAVESKQG